MTDIAVFGYGSLVNLATLSEPPLSYQAVTLEGWRRVWLDRPARAGSFAPVEGLAFLSIEPHHGSSIDGLLAEYPAHYLPILDARESLYDRQAVHIGKDAITYVATPLFDSGKGALLRSYLDAVMSGFLHHFGVDGLERFVASTAGFERPVREDRSAPIYPRAIGVSVREQRLFDALVPPREAALGA